MSKIVRYSSLSKESKQYINKTLIIHVVDDEYGDNSYTVRLFAFNLDIDEVYLPMRFEFDKSLAGYKQIEYIIPNDRHGVYSEKNIIFKRDLLENKERDQQTVFKDACTRLQTNGSILLALKTGFGKTDIALNFCRQYKLKTVMITYSNNLKEQFEERSDLISDLKIQYIKGKVEMDPDANIYIMSCCTFKHKRYGLYKNIGILIIDEAHQIATKEYFVFLKCFCPRFCIALTATPDKATIKQIPDYYFGTDHIVRKESNKILVYAIKTGIKPKIEYNMMGKPNWDIVLKSLYENDERNIIITHTLTQSKFKKKHILVVSKRIKHCEILYDMLKYLNDMIDYKIVKFMGKAKTYDKKANIILSTLSKFGVGIDNEHINMIFLVLSTKDIRQLLGRIRINESNKCTRIKTIVDFIDDNSMLYNQYLKRRKTYKEVGNVYNANGKLIRNDTIIKIKL